MNFKRLKTGTIISAVLGALTYSVVAGKGLFNRPRFRDQHEALTKYMDNNYPGCIYTPITMHGNGWSSAVIRNGQKICLLYFTKGKDGIYIFKEIKPSFNVK